MTAPYNDRFIHDLNREIEDSDRQGEAYAITTSPETDNPEEDPAKSIADQHKLENDDNPASDVSHGDYVTPTYQVIRCKLQKTVKRETTVRKPSFSKTLTLTPRQPQWNTNTTLDIPKLNQNLNGDGDVSYRVQLVDNTYSEDISEDDVLGPAIYILIR